MRHLYDLPKSILFLFPLVVTGMNCSRDPAPEDPFWTDDFKMVEIPSSLDGTLQKAYFFNPENPEPGPLLVSLHSWSGNYTQRDTLAYMARSAGWNYMHPDFRGRNVHYKACCSEYALNDIDDAIDFACRSARVDSNRIFVAGASGGGYATLAAFMKSRHPVAVFSAWVPISDLVSWYWESRVRETKYASEILDCTGSADEILDVEEAKKRSPAFWRTPDHKLKNSRLEIHAGIYDGIRGSVPITQSINFYNKILQDMEIGDQRFYVSDSEKLYLLEKRVPLADDPGNIGSRKIILKKQCGNLKLVIFEGGHEMLAPYVFQRFKNF